MTPQETPIRNNNKQSTFDPARYLDIVVYRDGRIEEDEEFSYDKYIKELDEEVEGYEEELDRLYDTEDIMNTINNIASLERLKGILKTIWEDYAE